MTIARFTNLTKRCRKRGGDCPCHRDECAAAEAIALAILEREAAKRDLDNDIAELKRAELRLKTPPATLRDGFTFDPRYQPVMVFDGDAATFGYENQNGDWIETNHWPFNEAWVWGDDCERLGIRVIQT